MYNEIKSSFRKHLDFILIDIICMEASFLLASYIRHATLSQLDNPSYRACIIIILFANLVACYAFNTYQDVLKRYKELEFYATIKQVFLTEVILITYLFLTKTSEDVSRNVIILFPILYLLISFIVRLLYKALLKRILNNKSDRQLIVITTKDRESGIKTRFKKLATGIKIKQIFLLEKVNVKDILKELTTAYVDEVLVSADTNKNAKIADKVSELLQNLSLAGIVVHIELSYAIDLQGSNNKLLVENIAGRTVLTATINTISSVQLIVKRIADIIMGIIGCIITLILAVFIGPIIYINSKGPIFFSQIRVGRNGKTFKIYKFRSMYMDAEKRKADLKKKNTIKSGMMFKIDNDPRVIKGIGEFIRKTSLDEFPQFINVLKGEMSVVGTRPPTLDEWEKYDLHHRARLAIKPGITGLWQVSGRSEIKNFEDVVKLDTEYIRNFSLWKDCSIIFKTIIVIFTGRGAK